MRDNSCRTHRPDRASWRMGTAEQAVRCDLANQPRLEGMEATTPLQTLLADVRMQSPPLRWPGWNSQWRYALLPQCVFRPLSTRELWPATIHGGRTLVLHAGVWKSSAPKGAMHLMPATRARFGREAVANTKGRQQQNMQETRNWPTDNKKTAPTRTHNCEHHKHTNAEGRGEETIAIAQHSPKLQRPQLGVNRSGRWFLHIAAPDPQTWAVSKHLSVGGQRTLQPVGCNSVRDGRPSARMADRMPWMNVWYPPAGVRWVRAPSWACLPVTGIYGTWLIASDEPV